MKINWDEGVRNVYRMGKGSADVFVVSDSMSIPFPPALVEGTPIVRGPTWQWEAQDEDGGCGTIGHVSQSQTAVCDEMPSHVVLHLTTQHSIVFVIWDQFIHPYGWVTNSSYSIICFYFHTSLMEGEKEALPCLLSLLFVCC